MASLSPRPSLTADVLKIAHVLVFKADRPSP